MPNVTTEYRLLQPAGHHRQPRNHASSIPLAGGGTAPEIAGQPGFRNAIEYTDKQFVFWSVTDGTTGLTTASTHVDYVVSTQPMRVTAWYLPTGGVGGEGGSGFLIDAFSVAAGDFVNDDFVTVTSDGSLTSQANVAGFIPTTSTQTADAFGNIGTEQFEHWIGASSASADIATFNQSQSGFAVATYKRGEGVKIPEIELPREGGIIIGGVAVDGGGLILLPGGGVSPIDPWGPLLEALVRGLALTQLAAGLKGTAARQLKGLAAGEIEAAAQAIAKQAKQR